MDRRQELLEAQVASHQVLNLITKAKKELQAAKSWGIFDMLGGGFFVSIIKRGRITQANRTLEQISTAMNNFLQELDDVDYNFPTSLQDSTLENMFDIWFDNIFTDIHVQGKLNTKLQELDRLQAHIHSIEEILAKELSEYPE